MIRNFEQINIGLDEEYTENDMKSILTDNTNFYGGSRSKIN